MLSDEQLMERLAALYEPYEVKQIAAMLADLRKHGTDEQAEKFRNKYLCIQGQKKGLRPDGKPLRVGFREEEVEAVLKQGGTLPLHEILRCRVRYFSDGLVLGSKQFVDAAFARYKDRFGLKRTSGARAMRYGDWNGLATMRDLRRAVIVVPPHVSRLSARARPARP